MTGTTAQVSISRIGTETIRVPIVGTAPLIVLLAAVKDRSRSPIPAVWDAIKAGA